MLWAFVFMFVVLKIPVCAALYLVWWSARDPATDDDHSSDSGGRGPHRPGPRWPRPPRRGPHAGASPEAPRRSRIVRPRRSPRAAGQR